jgi:hypothetical protein
MAETKRFPVRALLSVTTGRLLTETDDQHDGNGIGWLYELLGWMTNDSPFTHQLPRFNDECKPWLLRWFPELETADAALPRFDGMLNVARSDNADAKSIDDTIRRWVNSLGLKAEYDVPRIPADDHEVKNPIDELVEMRGGRTDGIIPVVISPTPTVEG